MGESVLFPEPCVGRIKD